MKKLLSKTPIQSGYWLPRPLVNPSPLETARKDFDITIIGGGFSGAAAAYHLSKISPDKAVLLLEARELADGATGRNGGLLWPSLPNRWSLLLDSFGQKESKKLLQFSIENCSEIIKFVAGLKSNKYPCHLNAFPRGAIHLMNRQDDFDNWQWEIRVMKEAGGVLDIGTLTATEVDARLRTKITHYGAIHDKIAFRIRPAHLVWHLLDQARSNFRNIFGIQTKTLVEGVEADSSRGGFKIRTEQDEFHSKQVIYTTNAYASDLLIDSGIVPIRNQVLVTKPFKRSIPFDFAITNNR
jgi:glycine/D-amino acid oxidase-like deaminating enzyme